MHMHTYTHTNIDTDLRCTQEQVESNTYPHGTERKSTPIASRNADSAAQGQQSHTQSGEVCVDLLT